MNIGAQIALWRFHECKLRAIYAWLANWNDTPKAFVWKAIILDKVRRGQ